MDLKPYGNSMAGFEVGLPLPSPPPLLFLNQTEAVGTGKSIFEPPPHLLYLKIEILGVLSPVFNWYPDTDEMKGKGTALPRSEIINSKKYLD